MVTVVDNGEAWTIEKSLSITVFNQVATDGVKTLKLASTDSKQIIFLAILDTQDQGLTMSDIINNNQYTLYRE